MGCVVYEIVTYKKLFVESSPVKIREKIETFECAKNLQNLRDIKNEEVKPMMKLVIEKFVLNFYFENKFTRLKSFSSYIHSISH